MTLKIQNIFVKSILMDYYKFHNKTNTSQQEDTTSCPHRCLLSNQEITLLAERSRSSPLTPTPLSVSLQFPRCNELTLSYWPQHFIATITQLIASPLHPCPISSAIGFRFWLDVTIYRNKPDKSQQCILLIRNKYIIYNTVVWNEWNRSMTICFTVGFF